MNGLLTAKGYPRIIIRNQDKGFYYDAIEASLRVGKYTAWLKFMLTYMKFMCYLVAKKFDKEGSLVLKAEKGQRLASLSKYLTLTTLEHGVQIITLNDLESYKEYAPYIVIGDEVEFISKVAGM